MTPAEYNALDINERANLLWGTNGTGKFVENTSIYGKYNINLYLLGDLVVSVFYDFATNKITDIKAWDEKPDKVKVMLNVSMN